MSELSAEQVKSMSRDEFDFYLYAEAVSRGLPAFENLDIREQDIPALEITQMILKNRIAIMEKLNREINARIRQMKEAENV